MFAVVFFFLCMFLATFAAQPAQAPNNTPVRLQFKDDGDQIAETTVHRIQWSPTINDAVENFGSQETIPVFYVDKKIFECLNNIMVYKHDPFTLIDPTNKEHRHFFASSFPTDMQAINRQKLLVQSNYLDIHLKLKRIVAEKYAVALIHRNGVSQSPHIPTFGRDESNQVIFDNLPHEVEPLVAEELCKILRTYFSPTKLQRTMTIDEALKLETISNTDAHGNFVYIASSPNARNARIQHAPYFFHVQVTTKSITTMQCPLQSFVPGFSRCSISTDGKYLLIAMSKTTSFYGCDVNIYDISSKINQYGGQYFTSEYLVPIVTYDIPDIYYSDIASIHFDENIQKFNILAPSIHSAKGYCFTVEPKVAGTLTSTCISGRMANIKKWSPLHNGFVGISVTLTEGLWYKNGHLLYLFYHPTYESWQYVDANEKKHKVDFAVIQDPTSEPNKIAVESLMVPDIDKAIATVINFEREPRDAELIDFDTHALCINRVICNNAAHPGHLAAKHTIEIHRLVPHEYAKALSMLSLKLHKNEHAILPDMYFLSLLYTKKLEQCPAIWKHISPQLKAIYRMDNACTPLTLYEKYLPAKTT